MFFILFCILGIVLFISMIIALLEMGTWFENMCGVWAKKYPKSFQAFWFSIFVFIGFVIVWSHI